MRWLVLLLFLLFIVGSGAYYFSRAFNPSAKMRTTLEHSYAYRDLKPQFKATMAKIKALEEEDAFSWFRPTEKLRELVPILRELGDAHVELYPHEREKLLSSGLKLTENNERLFFEGDSYELLGVDDLLLEEWILRHQQMVNSSSSWGLRYRTLELLKSYPATSTLPRPQILRIKNDEGERELKLSWNEARGDLPCASAEKIAPKVWLLSLRTLWCARGEGESRSQILERFKKEFNLAWESIPAEESVALDLRGNRGGGDEETRFVLQHFISKRVFLYRYQYAGDDAIKVDYLDPLSTRPKPVKLVTLIDSGCGSSCEVIASVLKSSGRSELLGHQTHGTAGEPRTLTFRKWSFSYPTARVWQEDGRLYEGIGVSPTKKVEGPSLIQMIEEEARP